ncbi:MAG: hypothetical protein PWQ79_2043 [Thermococcaceae archaeon]|nr:hypothetical protein [Thermococcaceae archaeon]MDK2915128.1 hypothetical protein [Thermococcaceae archaeon]
MEGKEKRIRLVVDTNVLFAAIINSGDDTAGIIFGDNVELYSPEFLEVEIAKYRELLMRKGKYEKAELLEEALEHLLRRITIIPLELYVDKIPDAIKATPDPKDSEFVALSMKLGCPLWTQDKELIEAEGIQTITTKELLEKLEKGRYRS